MPFIPHISTFCAMILRLIALASLTAGGDPELFDGAATLLMIAARYWPRSASSNDSDIFPMR
jgi:hypothetical protein